MLDIDISSNSCVGGKNKEIPREIALRIRMTCDAANGPKFKIWQQYGRDINQTYSLLLRFLNLNFEFLLIYIFVLCFRQTDCFFPFPWVQHLNKTITFQLNIVTWLITRGNHNNLAIVTLDDGKQNDSSQRKAIARKIESWLLSFFK